MNETEVRQPETLREQAMERLKKKRDFHVHLMVYLVVNGALVLLWALTWQGFFWPMFPMVGWGIGLFFHAWDTYRRQEPTKEQIEREMRRLSGRDR